MISDRDPYTMGKLDGSKRDNAAPTEATDRSISYAAHHGSRLIWIDQECIDQGIQEQAPPDVELSICRTKAIAVQPMDRLYTTSLRHWSTFLYDHVRDQVDALILLDNWG